PGDHATVAVTILSGTTVVASASAGVSGATWSYSAGPLPDGTYTAQAKQSDDAGNTGASTVRTFKIDTSSPSVTLEQPPSPSNDTTPSFAGTASDTTTVTVQIYKGAKAEGSAVATAKAAGTGGGWSSGPASPTLTSGEYTAIATQPSSLGNPPGASSPVTFTVDTSSPTVTLDAPPKLSNNNKPSFT